MNLTSLFDIAGLNNLCQANKSDCSRRKERRSARSFFTDGLFVKGGIIRNDDKDEKEKAAVRSTTAVAVRLRTHTPNQCEPKQR